MFSLKQETKVNSSKQKKNSIYVIYCMLTIKANEECWHIVN